MGRVALARQHKTNDRLRTGAVPTVTSYPRLAVVSGWSSRSPRLHGSPIGAMRVAAADSEENAARLASLRDAEREEANKHADEMHAALAVMQNSGDSRPESVRSVVDAYAASLLDESSEVPDTNSDAIGVAG